METLNTLKVVLCFLPERFGRGKIFSLPPLGILNIATYLKSTNIDVSVIDAFVKGWDLSKIVNYISRLKPDILGISTLTPQVYSAIKLVHEIKKHTDAKVCVGGPHVTATKGELFNYCDIDFIIRGEGESSFYKLCHALQTEDYSNIKGLLYKKNGEIVENAGFEMINDINSLPFPDLSLLDWRDYSILDGVSKYATSIMSSRGCPYSCLFCEVALVQGKKLRLRQPENICEEIEYDHNMFGIREFVFKDSTFTVKKD